VIELGGKFDRIGVGVGLDWSWIGEGDCITGMEERCKGELRGVHGGRVWQENEWEMGGRVGCGGGGGGDVVVVGAASGKKRRSAEGNGDTTHVRGTLSGAYGSSAARTRERSGET
jgi:hypothetical protein